MIRNNILTLLILLLCCSCASKKHKGIAFSNSEKSSTTLKLNVFEIRKKSESKRPVVIFVHGGYWTEGDKDIYGFLGRNFAKNDIVTVIPSYTLSPNGNYDDMANDVVDAIKWTRENIESYGGDADRIYLMGHSAGGHLIALATTNSKYKDKIKLVKGVILNDAAGLDMYSFLKENPPTEKYNYRTTWTEKPELWKDASPIYHLSENSPPFLIYVGEKTYESIKNQNKAFAEVLNEFQPNVSPTYLDKKHVPMMSQFFWPWNKRYDEIVKFIGLQN